MFAERNQRFIGHAMLRCVIVLLFLPVLLYAQEWNRVESGVTVDLFDVFFVNKDVGWAVGDNNTIIKSTDGGRTWAAQECNAGAEYRTIWFNDEDHGWIGGMTNNSPYNGVIIATSDGGASWNVQYWASNWVEDIQFTSVDTGYAVGKIGVGSIMKTTNNGKDWIVLGTEMMASFPGGGFQGVSFIDNNVGWICGGISFFDNHENELIFKTTDGGETWIQQDAPLRTGPLREIRFTDSLHGFSGGYGIMIKTTNGGAEWLRLSVSEIKALTAVSTDNVYIATNNPSNSGVFESRDGAVNWRGMSVEDYDGIYGIYLVDTSNGFAVGGEGKIWVKYMTTGIEVNPEAMNLTHCEIYPNPSGLLSGKSVHANLRLSPSGNRVSMPSLWNALGEHIDASRYTVTQSPEGWTLDVSRLNNGVYFIRVNEGGAVGKLVVCNK